MALLDLLGRRWTLRVLWELREGPVKFRDLARRADAMSQSVLSRRLNELETACFVTSDEDGWRLTDNGSELLQVFSPLSRFATRWAELLDSIIASRWRVHLSEVRVPVLSKECRAIL